LVQSDGRVKLGLGTLDCALPNGAKEVIVAIRPEDVAVSREPSDVANEFAADLESKTFLGDITVYNFSINGTKLRGKTTQADRELVAGSKAHVRLPPTS
jgi:ABC-type Fe3+/spermidine/putrescine transport system ATPase subunit